MRRTLLAAGMIAVSFFTTAAPASESAVADNLPAIIRFVEAHQSDINELRLSDPDGILGSKEDQHTYRVAKGIAAAQHQNLKKHPHGTGWYYLGILQDFSSSERNQAKAYAAQIWSSLQPALEAQGFQLRKNNPWDTFTMTKAAGTGVIQVWLDFTESADGTHIMLRVSPNVG